MENPFRRPFPPGLKIIETVGRDAGGIPRLNLHLARMGATARLLSFPFDGAKALALLAGDEPARLRLTLDEDGGFHLETAPLPAPANGWTAAISSCRADSADPWLRVKTTTRAIHDAARAEMGGDEVILLNERGEVTEGSVTNLFADFGQGLVTPPLSSGLLPGILRAELLATGRTREAVLTPADLRHATRLYAGNSLRGLIPLRLLS